MTFELPALPYDLDALAPVISRETLEFHHGKHHQAYVNNLNNLLPSSDLEGKSLEDIIKSASGGIFNNAAQIWNHSFYWNSISPNGGKPQGALGEAIIKTFNSFDNFKAEFTKSATTLFGSGWTWLVQNNNGELEILNTVNAGTPITDNKTPLFTCDVWEHAYYIDYRNARPKYLEAFWEIVNWEFASENFSG